MSNTEASSEQTQSDMGNEIEKKAGPWKHIQAEEEQEEVVEVVKPEAPPSDGRMPSAYVPPSLRNQQQPSQLKKVRWGKGGTAPDIRNKEFFPTLSGAKTVEKK